MNLEDLRFARFKPLDDAIADWTTMVRNLVDLETEAHNGLRGQANKANWTGVNATVSRKFIGRTAEEFKDAHTQATSIKNILSDTRDELKEHQRALEAALDRALKKNLTVTSTAGGGFTVTMNIHPDRAAKGTTVPEHSESDVTLFRDEIQGILDRATQSDSSAATVLRALADQSRYGFSGAAYKDRDSADGAIKEADRLARLARQKPGDLSVKEFDELNAGLKKYADDELFAERFAAQLGAKGTLEFWAGVNDPHDGARLGHERVGQYGELQKNLSLTLATASQSDSQSMTDWKRDMTGLGSQPVGRPGGPMGFQVMSNLMRWGDFDDGFLKSYGSELIKTEKKITDNGGHAPLAWQRMGMDPFLNRTGTDSGSDPMTGFMKALSNSPDAATDFFSDPFVTKDEDHDFKREGPDGKEVKAGLSNFDYLFEERDWPQEQNSEGERSNTGRNAMALALEAATTGHPAGELPGPDTPAHNARQANLMKSLVSSIADDPERLTKHGYMSDSVGQIAAEYLPDITLATTDDTRGSAKNLFPIAEKRADLSHASVTRFLVSVGQNPEGFANVEVGQKAYMANLLDYHMNPDLPDDLRYPHSPEDTVKEIARRSGEVGGTIAVGRQEAVLGPASQADGDFEDAVAQKKNTWSGAIGTGVGVGVSFIATPVGGAVASGVAGTVSSVVLEHIFQQSEPDQLQEAGKSAGAIWEASTKSNVGISQLAAETAVKAHGAPYGDQALEWARIGTLDGFGDASVNVAQMADDLETEIQPG
ncbi:DUF6571 family protein [Streptomyces sp. SID3212]|uniref:DUF6571 family protein n=1 Tax=Streptomyces sp. SID3212 TaxID=2690259 RepID=UPI00136FF4AC|nr:DUF6571 family protein [Streptomyces sp. SID3212]MYV57971.1 hypothetical protein [Streptomyces sp. SID3212]